MMTVYEEKGIEKGIQLGMQQEMQQGLIESTKQDVMEVLELKFATLPHWVQHKIANCNDLNTLKNLHRQAILADSIDELQLP